MKILIPTILLMILLVSCRTQKPPTEVPVETVIQVRDRIVEVQAVEDSSSIKALFACDSNNRVVLKDYNALWSRYMSVNSAAEAMSNGDMRLSIVTNTNHPATTTIAHDSIITRDVPIYMPGAPYPVEKELNWIQKTLMYTGAAAWILLLIFIVTRFYNPLKFK